MEPDRPARRLVVTATILLFLVWSNSFVAMSYLLGREAARQRFDWLTLTTGRFAPVTLLAALFPAAFTGGVLKGEIAGGAVVLAGLAVALLR